jgi:hypothetical protein
VRNAPLLAEIRRRRMYAIDPIYDQMLQELDVLYATIDKLSRLSMQLEREAEIKEKFNGECS